MAEFKLVSDFQPMGDQPQAIEKLVEGLNQGMRHQVLLGATGTGKSVGYSDPVYIVEQDGAQKTARVTPIGPLIDSLMAAQREAMELAGDTDILYVADQ